MLERSLMIDLTYDCNMHCPWCILNVRDARKEKGPMPQSMFGRLIQLARQEKYDVYCFHGGEPLLYPDLMKEIVAAIRDRQSDARFKLYTNGTLLTPALVEYLNRKGFTSTVSMNVTGYKGLEHFMRYACDASNAFHIINQLHSCSIRSVYGRLQSFAIPSIVLHNIFPRFSIETVPDYTLLHEWTNEDIAFVQGELDTLADRAPDYKRWHFLLQGFKGYCKCENKKHLYVSEEEIHYDVSAPGTSGCCFFREQMDNRIYEKYQDLCEAYYGGTE